ncbi:MFS transporter [Streptacidiphilus rugosus]|uniref:MFS transporter n=1 Tax=Streptacidiphilus rugosus TaxID=405783 RepID=UPI000B0380B5|nr:MFS transporter [Streptacidiphilus rugosus]
MVALAQLTVLAGATASNIAVPTIVRDLHMSSGDTALVSTLYLLGFGALLFAGGHVADHVGRRTTLVVGLLGFALASAIAGLAPGFPVLAGARLLQGGAAALVSAAGLALVSTGFTDPKERGRAFAVYGAIVAGGSTLGLLTGGWLVEELSWRMCFFVAVPVAAVAVVGAFTLLPEHRGPSGVRPDPVGLLLGCLGLAAVLGGVNQAPSHGWTAPLTLVPTAIGVALLAGLACWLTASGGSSMLPHPFRDRNRVGSLLALTLAGAGLLVLLTALTYCLQQTFGYTLLGTGAAFLPMVAAITAAAALGSTGPLRGLAPGFTVAGGLLLAAIGTALLTTLQPQTGYVTGILPGLVLAGLGIGLAWPSILATATAGSPDRFAGALGATVTATQQLGTALGAAFFAAYLTGRTRDLNGHLNQVPTPSAIPRLFLQFCTDALWWATGGLVLAAVLAAVLATGRSGRADS